MHRSHTAIWRTRGNEIQRQKKIANSVYSPGRARCAHSGPGELAASQRRRPEDDHESVRVRGEDRVDDALALGRASRSPPTVSPATAPVPRVAVPLAVPVSLAVAVPVLVGRPCAC